MTQTSLRPRLPQSWQLTPQEAQRALLPLLTLAVMTSSTLTGLATNGAALLLALALLVSGLVPARRVAAGLGLGAALIVLGLLLLAKHVVVLGGLVFILAPRLGQPAPAR